MQTKMLIKSSFFVLTLLLWICEAKKKRVHNISSIEVYRYALDIGSSNMCPMEYKNCHDEKESYLCKMKSDITSCADYREIEMTNSFKSTFVQGHNGIRNKVATDFQIANMNLVYWDRRLASMASKFLYQCYIGKDACDRIGYKGLLVTQNYLFVRRLYSNGWPGRVVRKWYLEIGYEVRNWNDFLAKRMFPGIQNFTHLIWPLMEFIGCGAAHMHQGAMIACYYYPPYNEKDFLNIVKLGKPCSNCNHSRPTCSKTFACLCGVDMIMDGAAAGRISWTLFAIPFLAIFYTN